MGIDKFPFNEHTGDFRRHRDGIEELNALYQQKGTVGGFVTTGMYREYYSSSQGDDRYTSWLQDFANSTQSLSTGKINDKTVRAVWAF